ncbi:SDR family oxidoreductase, partial [Synechococcus sp. H55.10]
MRAFVAGATGETGRRIVKELVGRGIPVRALVRSRELAAQVLPPEAEVVVGDVLDPATLRAGMEGCTVVLCATGARPSWDPLQPYRVDYEGTKNLVNVAKAQGIQHFVLISSLCVSQLFHPLNLFWLILVWKKRAEEYLQKSGLTYTIIRPGGLKNQDNEDGIVLSQADTLFEGSIPR